LLIGNSGLAIATHYCGGLAMESQMVVGHAELQCGMSNMDSGCENEPSRKNHFKEKPCCENQYQSLELEDTFEPQVIGSSLNLEFVASFVITYIRRSYSSNNDNVKYNNYSPPLIERDIQVLVQSFLI